MSYPFTCNITDTHLDHVILYDFECEISVEVTLSGGDLSTSINDVLVDGRSLFRGDEISRALGARAANLAEDEIDAGGALWDAIREAEGLVMRGRGASDPDAHWARVA